MENYEKFMSDIKRIKERRKMALSEVKMRKKLLVEKGLELDQAELMDEDTKLLSDELVDLRQKLAEAERRMAVSTVKPSCIEAMYREDPEKSGEALEILAENSKAIVDLQAEFDKIDLELQFMKSRYLEKVAEMGTLYRKAEGYAMQNREVTKYIKGKEQMFHMGIVTDINGYRKTGSIFLKADDCMWAFRFSNN